METMGRTPRPRRSFTKEFKAEVVELAPRDRRGGRSPLSGFPAAEGLLREAALRLVAHLGHDLVMWSVSRGAFDVRSPDLIAEHVVGRVDRGGIIDLTTESAEARSIGGAYSPRCFSEGARTRSRFSRILEELASRVFQLATVSELLAASPRDR